MPLIRFEEFGQDGFFPTFKLAYQVQGMMISQEFTFTNFFENVEYTARPNGSDVVIKGLAGEMWRAPLRKVRGVYSKEDGRPPELADFIPDRYIPLYTRKEEGYFACFVPPSLQVQVKTAWGDTLIANREGAPRGNGDYLVCRAGQEGKPNFSDIWVVNGLIFPLTYDQSQRG
jgi:hypothetical protein